MTCSTWSPTRPSCRRRGNGCGVTGPETRRVLSRSARYVAQHLVAGTACCAPGDSQEVLDLRLREPGGTVTVSHRNRDREFADVAIPRRAGHRIRQRRSRLAGHVDDQNALAAAAVDPVDIDIPRRWDYALADQLAVAVQIHQTTGYRTKLGQELLVEYLPGRKPTSSRPPVFELAKAATSFANSSAPAGSSS